MASAFESVRERPTSNSFRCLSCVRPNLRGMASRCRARLSQMDLRFSHKKEEASFKESLEDILYLSTVFVCIGLVCGGMTITLGDFRAELQRKDGSLTFAASDPRTFRYVSAFSSFIFIPFLTLAVLLLGWLSPRVRTCISCLDIERVAVAVIIFPNVMVPFYNGWTAAKLYGQDPSEVWIKDMRGSETSVALSVDTINTCLCLFVPIRMCLKWIPAVAGAVAYSVYASNWTPFPAHSAGNIFCLWILTLLSLWGAWRNEGDARQRFIAQGLVKRKTKEHEVQHAGACRVLDRLCDSLVELGSDLCIRNPSPRLAALLLRPKDSLEGTNFSQYLSSESDRQRFVSALQGDNVNFDDADKNGGMVQVSLRDAPSGFTDGREFSVYAYHTCIFDDTGAFGHMIALVEAQERTPLPNVLDVPDIRPLEAGKLPSIRSDESGSSVTSSEVVKLENKCPGEVSAWLDTNSEDMTIRKCSAGFTVFGPISEGCSFSGMVARDTLGFRRWFQKAVNCKIHGLLDPSLEPYCLRLCTSPNAKIEFAAICKAHLTIHNGVGSTDDIDDSNALCVVFSEIKVYKRKRLNRPWQSPQKGALTSNRKRLSL